MAVASSSSTTDNTVHSVLFLLLLVVLVSSSSSAVTEVAPSSDSDYSVYSSNQSSSSAAHRVGGEVSQLRLRRIREHLKKINKSPVKTIQSLDGDVIDCVISHQQPAFDHPLLMGQKPITEVPPGRPRSGNEHQKNRIEEKEDGSQEMMIEQIWRMGGEECPEGTVPIRRVTEDDILRVSSIWRFGRKKRGRRRRFVRRDTSDSDHEHAVGYVTGNQYFGGKASINVWAPRVANPYEFSLSQIWVISGSFGGDLNTIEAGWQVSPELYGDNRPRFFTYWTSDAYQSTGCYNLLCSGFVQTNNRIAIGAAISPTSTYRGGQFDITLLIWKDPKHGHWWLEFGNGILVGYWPSLLFTRLRSGGASMVQFGGEAVNTRPGGSHTATQMGSGHYADEGFGKSSYFRNIEVVDWDNSLVPPPSGLKLVADHPNCYDVRGGRNRVWGDYFYYGGPGRSVRCP